mmetsp:Transcript_41880/g.58887  ORF Transcript_41880/g.58887 Transcript_41880/m.58887 type:complete len:275 (-) Transcript_41880:110-934(-)|eukprot:CAMPEP_0202443970 /NCGR_PEP_ID=MMETSP1360-20130828/3129_1 /ASSEMBLY_ACC=CAM_ASM_000848 /TAXON_ID=515479 /ORGANISM="Licmophora paradoxa, Strain CCMP2313" /LENGTH=274 /DNA_ID=CAMNT_0049059819 /DNA_START=35 /DNA_END=859 /DNA_ORIENTATION=+
MPILVVDGEDDAIVNAFIDKVNLLVESGETSRVAVDCEGVNLGRLGTLEILSIAFEDKSEDVYLLDFKKYGRTLANAIAPMMENQNIVKIIHDSRMDCDALFHLHGILVINVHDTSCFHNVIHNTQANLNDTLSKNGIPENTRRSTSVYKTNPKFWSTRPLSYKMKEWASGDVASLFTLASMQSRGLSPTQRLRAESKSEEWTKVLVEMDVERMVKCNVPIGRFIGRGGSNIRAVERQTGCQMYKSGVGRGDEFDVYYSSESSLKLVKKAMGHM